MNELDHELLIFDRPTRLRVGDDWTVYPHSALYDIPTEVAEELLTLLSDDPVSAGLRALLGQLRGEVRDARSQTSMELS